MKYRISLTSSCRRAANLLKTIVSIGLAVGLLLAGALPVLPASQLEREVLQEMNLARTDPEAFIPDLQKRRALFEGKRYRPPGATRSIITQEGPAAVDEAIAFLRKQDPLPPLAWEEGLARSAAELVRAQVQSGETGHGIGDLELKERIERHVQWVGSIAENVSYGPDEGREVVLQMIVDDGVPDRGHRETIFSRQFRLAGVACGPHPTFRTVCVIDFAAGVRE